MFLYSFFSNIYSIGQLIKYTSFLLPKNAQNPTTQQQMRRERKWRLAGANIPRTPPQNHVKGYLKISTLPFLIRDKIRRLENHLNDGTIRWLFMYTITLYANDSIEKMRKSL